MSGSISDVLDQTAGKAQKAQGESLGTFLASLTTSGAILGLGITAYYLLKWKCPEYYYQRAHQIPDSKWKPTPLHPRMFFSPIPDPDLKHASGFENYLFDRYLQIILRIFILLGLIILPVLLPLNIIDGRNELGGVTGLDRLSYLNIGLSHTSRYWAHLVLAIFTIISVCYTIQAELRNYARLRGSLMWDGYKGSCLLLISTSEKQLSAHEIKRRFHNISGGTREVTINRDFSGLRVKLSRRDALIRKLEVAETTLIMRVNHQRAPIRRVESEQDGDDSTSWTKCLHQKDRPSMRLPLFPWLPTIPLIGPQVDAIHHLRAEVARHNLEIEWYQLHPNEFPQINSAFVHFNRTLSIPLAAVALKARIPPTWTLKHGTTANDTIWRNVSISWWQQCIQSAVVNIFIALLTLGYIFPVTILGSLSQIEYLVHLVSWLGWIESLPSWLVAVIQGVLPPVMLALVTAAVPVALRLLVNMQGHHSHQVVENYIQIYYYTFLFVQVFLAVSLSAGITAIIGELADKITTSTPAVLAQNLPKACNYFFSYILIHTFTTIAFTLVNVNGLIALFVLSPLFDKTARQKWMRGQTVGLQKWGTFIPVFTNIACIGLIYAIISPLILIFSTIYFGALWLLYRSYPPKLTEDLDPSGLFYPTAIRQLFIGVYFMELCLAGLFFLVRDADGQAACTPQAIIMIFAAVLTALFHYALNHGHKLHWLPKILEQKVGQFGNKVRPKIPQANLDQDDALTSARPILWIPKDELGVADGEIDHTRKTYNSIWISNEGASLDERGKLKVWGNPPGF